MSQKPASRPRLGRGLSSLIPAPPTSEGEEPRAYFLCAVDRIDPMSDQPRQYFDQAALDSLSASIRESGILQPLVVRAADNGRFRLIAGERRFRAAQLAGLAEVPVVVRDVTDREAFTLALIENVQREDLNPIEEADAYRQLIDDYGLTHEETAQRAGRSRAAVTNTLRLLQLPSAVREFLISGAMSAGHARAILTGHETHRAWLAHQVLDLDLSVRATEALARQTQQPDFSTDTKPSAKAKTDDSALYTSAVREAERRLRERIGHQVKIKRQADRTGVIELHFSDDEALNAILDALLV